MFTKKRTARYVILFVFFLAVQVTAQHASGLKFETKADGTKTLYATVSAKEIFVANDVFEAWVTNQGLEVVFSGSEGNSGESASLRIYNVRTAQTRKVIYVDAAYFFTGIMEFRMRSGRRLIFVKTGDEVVGAAHFWVVDPRRGAIFYRDSAVLKKASADLIHLDFYNDGDWQAINDEVQNDALNPVLAVTTAKPRRRKTFDLRRIVKQPVIDTRKIVRSKN